MDFKKYLQMVAEADQTIDEGEVIKGPWKGSTEPAQVKASIKSGKVNAPTNDYLMITKKVADIIENSGVRFADDPAYDIENALKKLKQRPTPFLVKKIFDEMVRSGLADQLGYEVDEVDLEEGKFKDMSIVSVNGKDVDVNTLKVDGINNTEFEDRPNYSDIYFGYGEFEDGTSLSGDELDQVGLENPDLLIYLAKEQNENVDESIQPTKKSLKDWFEQIDKEMIAENTTVGMKPLSIFDPTNKDAGVGVLSSTNPAIQKMLGNLDPKDVKIVMTKTNAPAAGTTQPNTQPNTQQTSTSSTQSNTQQGVQTGLSTGGGATAVKEDDVMEKAPPGMEKLVLKLKKQYPGKPELAFATAWKVYNKKHGKEEESVEEAFGAGSTFSKSSSRLDRSKSYPAMSPDSDNEPRGKITVPQKDREEIARILGKKEVTEKWAGGAEVKPTGQYKDKSKEELKSMLAKLHKSGPHDKDSPAAKKMRQINFALRAKGGWKSGKGAAMKEAEIPHSGPDYGAGLGAGRDPNVLETKKVNESMNTLEAAYHEGKSHGLSKHSYACRYDEGTDEHRKYHEGFKEGLDECYGLMPNQGLVDEADMEEGNAFTGALARTPHGGKFSVGGKSFTDTSSYDSTLDEYAFESLENKLNALLNEGLSVNMSQGLGGPTGQGEDTVSVTATGDDSAKLLDFIKTVGLGGLGGGDDHAEHGHDGSEPALAVVSSDYGAPKFSGHDGMKDLMAKITGGDFEQEGGEDEEHSHGEESEEEVDEGQGCNECGMTEGCGCHESETPNQETDEMAEDAAADAEEAETTADEDAEAEEDATKSSSGGSTNEDIDTEEDDEDEASAEESVEESLNEWANEAGKDGTEQSFERDIEFMTKVISGGLNKPKSTGQTTIPVVAHQDARTGDDDVAAWKKLAGLGK